MHALHQSFHFQKFQGAQILIFFVKIGMELPFTLKNKRSNTNLKFDFLKVPLWTPKKCVNGFWRNPPPKKKNSSCFGFYSALKSIDTQMFFWLVFLKTHKKGNWLSKTPFWPFLAVNNVFLWVFKNTDQKNKNMKTKFVYCFYFKTQKCPFLGVNKLLF